MDSSRIRLIEKIKSMHGLDVKLHTGLGKENYSNVSYVACWPYILQKCRCLRIMNGQDCGLLVRDTEWSTKSTG